MANEARQPFEANEESALRILAGRKVVSEAGTFEEPITVHSVSYGKKDPETGEISENFYWEDADGNPDLTRQFVIVNLQAMSADQYAEAERLYDNGDFDLAIGKEAGNLSLRMDVEKAEELKLDRGSVVSATFDWRERSSDGEAVLVCTAISPMKSKAGKNSFAERLAAAKAEKARLKAEAEAEAANETP